MPRRSLARLPRPPKRPTRRRRSAAKAAREAASAKASLRKLERLKSAADDDLADAEKAVASAKTDQAKARAEEQKLKAAAKATEAGTKLDTAKADATSKIDAAAKAADAAKEAATRKTDTAKAANDAKLALEPVSIYISRATQKLYVRRNTHKPWPDGGEVFDATIEVPVMIRDPDRPIGTHVFTAMARNDAGLRWTAVTIDNGDDAKDALDRISIPKEVLDRIAPTALPRSSIIVSDEPLSRETNYRTEFVAVLSNQPQGGFITRRPTISFPPEAANPGTAAASSASLTRRAQVRNLAIAGGAAATIRCNGAGGSKRRHADRWPPGPVTGSTVALSAGEVIGRARLPRRREIRACPEYSATLRFPGAFDRSSMSELGQPRRFNDDRHMSA